MNILYIAGSAPIHDYKWINLLSGKKDVNAYLLRNSETEKKDFDYEKTDTNNVTITKEKIYSFSVVRFWKTFYSVFIIRRIIKKCMIDIVHIMYADPHALWVPFIISKKVKIVITTHGTDILKTIPGFSKRKDLLGKLVFKLYKKAFIKVGKVTCTSKKQAENVTDLFGKNRDTEIIRSGIILPPEHEKKVFIKQPYILFPRTMRSISNHELAIESIKLLSKDLLTKYSMVFIDADSKNTAYVRKIKNMSGNVPRAGFVFLPSLPPGKFLSVIKNASLIVITNTSDGSPVTAMEAMYFKTPLILPPLDYDKELFGEGVLFFNKWKPASVKEKIDEILKEPKKEQNKRLQTAYKNVMEFGNFEKEMNKMYNIYKVSQKINRIINLF